MSEVMMNTEVQEGSNEPEVTEPVDTQEGSNEQNLAESVTEPTEVEDESGLSPEQHQQNKAFQELRHKAEEAQRRAQEAEARALERERDLELLSQATGSESPVIDLLAKELDLEPEDVEEILAEEEERARLEAEIEALREERDSAIIEQRMKDDLLAIQAIDPNVKSLDDLGEGFFEYVGSGKMPGIKAYFAVKAEEAATKSTPPKAPGKLANTPVEKDFYTEAEIDAMSKDEIKKNMKKVKASLQKIGKKE